MTIKELVREKVTVPQWPEEQISLGAEAEQVLGYKVLRQHQDGETKAYGPLRRALASLDIEILSSSSVEKYQDERLKSMAREKFEEFMVSRERRAAFYMPSWTEIGIKDYPEPIPEYVLNKALQIKRTVPECEVLVEYLSETPDPFLLVRLGKKYYNPEEFYIEVWEEPKFEGR